MGGGGDESHHIDKYFTELLYVGRLKGVLWA